MFKRNCSSHYCTVNSEQPFEADDDSADDLEQPEHNDDEMTFDDEDDAGFDAGMEDEHEERGRVKFFNGHKGFGFIKAEDEEEYFVHISDVRENLELDDNMPVAFNVEEGEKGPKAANVKILPQDTELDLPDDVSDD